MLPLDATELYDLPEAGRLLFADPARLRRWARQQRVPLYRGPGGDALPRAWVDAETGRTPTDADGLRRYWLERLAPPSPEAQRAQEDRERLPSERLLGESEAARSLFADAARLRRMAKEGSLPPLLVDGRVTYDGDLVQLAAEGASLEARRAEVAAWGRFAYVTGLHAGAEPPPAIAKPAPAEAVAVAPHAWRIPKDVAEIHAPEIQALPASTPEEDPPAKGRLLEADGFETIDEDP